MPKLSFKHVSYRESFQYQGLKTLDEAFQSFLAQKDPALQAALKSLRDDTVTLDSKEHSAILLTLARL